MEIFSSGANNIINIISKYKNNNINNKELNRNLLTSIIFHNYYFKKDEKKVKKEKEVQQQLYYNFLTQEEKQIKNEKIYLSKERNIKRKEEIYRKFSEERKLMLDNYKEKKYFTSVIEPTFDCYIPIKQLSIPIEFYTNKTVPNIFGEGPQHDQVHKDNDDYYIGLNDDNDNDNKKFKKEIIKGVNEYKIDVPLNLDEKENNYYNDDVNDIDNVLDILETDDKLLFYEDELLDLKTQKESIYNKTEELILPIKEVNALENKELDKNLSKSEILENHFKEFSSYLSLSTFTKFIKKMNYIYLHLMLMNYFDLEEKINTGLDLYKDIIIINHVKKMILQSGICSFPLYDKIIKNVSNQKEALSFENFLFFFDPLFKADEEFQSYKYKYLLNLSKNKYSELMTQLEFDMYLNLIKGKKIFDKEAYSDLMKRFKVIYKKKYSNENIRQYYIFTHVYTVIEYIIDLNYDNLSDY